MKIDNNNYFYVCIDCFYEINGFENEFILKDKKELVIKSVKNIPYILEKAYDFREPSLYPRDGFQRLTFLPCDSCGEPCHGHRIRYKIKGVAKE